MTENNSSQDTSFSIRHRKLTISTNILIQLIAVTALVVMANWFASRHYIRTDWTKSGYYELSEKTKQVLEGLVNPVNIVVFIPPGDQRAYVQKTLDDIRDLLKELEYFGKEKIRTEYVDPHRDLARAKFLAEKYEVDAPDVVIFACGDRHKYVRVDELVDLEVAGYGESGRIKAFKGESAFLTAIQTVTEEASPKVVFLAGHGERDPLNFDEQNGYSVLTTYIKRDNILVEKWNLLEKQSLPTDASLLVIAGPRTPYTDSERRILDEYLKKKGRLLVMLDPRQESGLEPFLENWGVHVGNNLILAKGGMLFGTELLIANALGYDYGPHPISAPLKGINTSFPYSRSIQSSSGSRGTGNNGNRVTELVKTPNDYWGETDLEAENASFNPSVDLKGPISLAVAVETDKPKGVDVDIDVVRMVVVGTSSFVDNSSISGANLDFAMNALNWLLHREQMVAVGPKVPDEFRLDMSPNQARAVYGLVIGGMPLSVATIGLIVWSRRRK